MPNISKAQLLQLNAKERSDDKIVLPIKAKVGHPYDTWAL